MNSIFIKDEVRATTYLPIVAELLLEVHKVALERPGKFDLARWAGNVAPTIDDCSSVGCAIGYAAGLFCAEGLVLVGSADVLYPYYDGLTTYDAVAAFFGLSDSASFYLFAPTSYPKRSATSAKEVSERIVEFLETAEVRS